MENSKEPKKVKVLKNFGMPSFPSEGTHRHVATLGFMPGDKADIHFDCKGFTHVFVYTVISEDAEVSAEVLNG